MYTHIRLITNFPSYKTKSVIYFRIKNSKSAEYYKYSHLVNYSLSKSYENNNICFIGYKTQLILFKLHTFFLDINNYF